MANTYSQLYVHYVFAVQNRICLIRDWKDELYKYMSGIVLQQGHKPLTIGGMPDHVHMLVSMSPTQAPSDLIFRIKRSSSLWINDKKLAAGKFSWQEGFGAFSYGKSQIPDIVTYIERQEIHHKKRSFGEEYKEFLMLFGIEYNENYVFKPLE